MQVLYISQKPAYPIVDGGSFAINRFLDDLNEQVNGQIDYLVISTKKHPFDATFQAITKKDQIKFHPIELNTALQLFPLLSSFFSKLPYNLLRYKKDVLGQKIEELLEKNDYDYVFLDGFYASAYLDKLRSLSKAKIIYRSHNIEKQIWTDYARTEQNSIKRLYLNRLAKKVGNYEVAIVEKVDFIAAICQTDFDYFKQYSSTKIHCVPVSLLPVTPAETIKKNSLCFIGNFGWFPNVDAINWFIKNVFTSLQKRYPDLTFHIAGFGSKEVFQTTKIAGVIVHGSVSDASEFLKTHGIFVSPIRIGSGIKIKVLEAMNAAVPVVLSQKSAEGINLSDKLSSFKTKEEAIDQLSSLLDSPIKLNENRDAVLGIIKEQFTQEIAIQNLKTIFNA